MSNTGWAAVILAIIIIAGGAWWYMSSQPVAPADTAGEAAGGTQLEGTEMPDEALVGGDASADVGLGEPTVAATVHYSASGFSPANATIKVGQAVRFVNDTSNPMWVAADEHPTHTEFDGTDRATHCSGTYSGATPFDQCQNGSTYMFVFSKAGTYEYHNHSGAQHGGTVVVQ